MTALGVLLAARHRTMDGFHNLMNFLLLPLIFLSGAFFPLRGVMLWLDLIARMDPVTYGVDPLRRVALQASLAPALLEQVVLHPILTNVLVMAAFGLAFLIPAVWLFGKQD